jgi:hypothetical protein
MSALTPAQAALRLLEHEHRPDPTQVSLRHTHRRYDHSVSTHLASPRRRFRTLPLSATSTRAGLGFVLPTRTRRVHPAVSSSSSYGLVIHLRLLPTSPRGDAVTVGYGPESACPGRTLTSLSVRACRRTWDAGRTAGVRDRPSQGKHKQHLIGQLFVFALRWPIPARAPRGPTGGAWRRMYHQVFFVAFVASCSSC